MKYQLLLAAALLVGGTSCSQTPVISAGTPVKIERKSTYKTAQPIYQIDFSAAACSFEVRVNDIVIMKFNINGQTGTNLPLNSAILQSGQQQITVKVLPLEGKKTLDHNAEFKYTIQVIDATKGIMSIKQLPGGYTFPAVAAQPPAILSHTETFNADVPYTTPSYENGEDLKSVSGLDDKVRKAYQQVADLLKKGDFDTFKKLIANRESIVSTNSYLSPQESAQRIESLINDCKNGFTVEPIPANAVVELEANGKIALLKRPNGDSALYMTNKKTNEEEALDLSLFMSEGARELEIR